MLRNTETRLLEISDFNWKNKKLKIRGEIAKRGKPTTINLSQECLDILQEYIKKYREKPWYPEDTDILFLRDGVRLSRTKMHELHKEYETLLGFRVKPHKWRHTGITEYARVEKDVKIVQRQARHSITDTTLRYINYATEEYENSYANFERKITQRDKPQPKPKPQPDIQPPQQTQPSNLKEQLTQRFIRGEISETSYLIALKSIEGTDNPVGYQ